MKLCPECFSEFRDDAKTCDDCQVALVSEAEGRALQAKRPAPVDGSTFVAAEVCDDPFDAEAYVAAVREVGVPVFSRAGRRGTVDVLVTAGAHAFWEILVPKEQLAAAREAIAKRRRELEAEQADAARAAEEEEAATENHEVVGEAESDAVAAQWAERLASAGISAVLRQREDVELDPADAGDPPVTLVLVPRDALAKAREVLRTAG